MITSTGRDIISKYLIGQTSSYASHIAIGCGPKPTLTLGDYATKTALDFEMDRFEIKSFSQIVDPVVISAGQIQATGSEFIITINGANPFTAGQTVSVAGAAPFSGGGSANGIYNITSVSGSTITVPDVPGAVPQTITGSYTVTGYAKKIVVTADLPINERYEITELGLYSIGSDPTLTTSASRTVANFTQDEVWQYVRYISGTDSTYSDVPYYSSITDGTNAITVANFSTTQKVFQTNSDNPFFNYDRVVTNQRPRFLQDCTIVYGGLSKFSAALTPAATSDYISISNFNLDLSKNSALDELRIAFSLIENVASGTAGTVARSLNIMLQFVTENGSDNAKYHFRDSDATSLTSGTGPYTDSRYRTLSLALNAATYTSRTTDFDWKNVRSLRIYASTETAANYSGVVATQWAIVLDAVRFENKSSNNPKYGLVAYTVVNSDGVPVVKDTSTNNLIEFRFVLGQTSYV